jgi:hypothetical protein
MFGWLLSFRTSLINLSAIMLWGAVAGASWARGPLKTANLGADVADPRTSVHNAIIPCQTLAQKAAVSAVEASSVPIEAIHEQPLDDNATSLIPIDVFDGAHAMNFSTAFDPFDSGIEDNGIDVSDYGLSVPVQTGIDDNIVGHALIFLLRVILHFQMDSLHVHHKAKDLFILALEQVIF